MIKIVKRHIFWKFKVEYNKFHQNLIPNVFELFFYSTDNLFKGKVEDATVQKYWNMFGTKSSTKAAAAGFPDFFVYKICEGYLFDKDMEIQFVEGNRNCLPTSILKTLDFEKGSRIRSDVYTDVFTASSRDALDLNVGHFRC